MLVIEDWKKLIIDYGIKELIFAAKVQNREDDLFSLRKPMESICRIVTLNEFGEIESIYYLDVQDGIWNNIQMEWTSFFWCYIESIKWLVYIKWNFIIDSNPDFKENRLYKIFSDKTL